LAGGDTEIASLLRAAGLFLAPALLVAGLRGLASGMDAWTLIAWERTLGALLRVSLIVGFAVAGNLTVAAGTLIISGTTVGGAIAYVALFARVRRTDGLGNDPREVPKFGRYALRIWTGSLAGIVLARLDQLLITPMAGVDELGLYVVAVSIAEVILVFNSAVRDVVFAAEAADANVLRLGVASRVSTIYTAVAGVAIAGSSAWFVPTLFGKEFEAAVPTLLVLIAAVVIGNPGSVAGIGLSARNRPGLRSWSLTAAVLVNLAVVALLVPVFGALGAAVATLIGSIVSAYLNIVWLRFKFNIPASTFLRIRGSDLRTAVVVPTRLIRSGYSGYLSKVRA
jgi:O-antigen/teichoic acid export membrane protein